MSPFERACGRQGGEAQHLRHDPYTLEVRLCGDCEAAYDDVYASAENAMDAAHAAWGADLAKFRKARGLP